MKIKEIVDEGVTSLISKGLSKLGSAVRGGARPAVPNVPPPPPAPAIRPSNIPKKQWKQMTPAQRQSVSGPAAPPTTAPSPGAVQPSLADQVADAKLKAELKALKGPGLGSKVAGAMARHPIYTAAGGTMAYHLAGEQDPLSGEAFGSAARKTAGTAANVVKGFVGSGDTSEPATAATDTPATGAETPQAAKPSDSSGEPSAQDQDGSDDSTTSNIGNYVDQIRQSQDERFGQWGKEANESVKKKIQVSEQTADFMRELEKNFPNPMVRNAILARIQHETGGRNVGEMSWSGTSNKRLKTVFPQLQNMSDAELTSLKQNNEKFLNYAYGGKIGNTDTGDGYKYRGRGPIQITGKSNYAELDKALGLKGALIKDPDLLLKNPSLGQAATIQYLKSRGADKLQAADQRTAHQALITMVGGKAYAPGTALGKSALAQAEQMQPADYKKIATAVSTATPVVASTGTTTPQAAKPTSGDQTSGKFPATDNTAEKPQTLAQKLDKIVQPEPRFYKRGELSIDQYMKKSQAEVDRLRAAAQRVPGSQMTKADPVPSAGTVNTTGTVPAVYPTTASAGQINDKPEEPDNSTNDKLQNQKVAVSESRLQPELKSVNKEIKEILRLAGQR